ncbi:Hemolysin II [Bacillus cereus F837/76]|nr:Hemolysin II [Bacillus cereus F837/76]
MKKANGIAKSVAVASVIMSGSLGLQATSAFADSKGTVEIFKMVEKSIIVLKLLMT